MQHHMRVSHILGGMTAGFFVIAACTTGVLAQKAVADNCTMTVETEWLQEFTVLAGTDGECGLGDISLLVRNSSDEVIWSASYRPDDLFGFSDVYTPEAMEAALTDWITVNVSEYSTGTLPEWNEGADGPEQGEFPFYIADGVDQKFYEMTRELDLLMACYVQGQESTLCLFQMPDESRLELIGYQSFPG